MIKRQVFASDMTMTIMTLALLQERAPPIRLLQLSRLFALALDVNRIGIKIEPICHIISSKR